MSTKRKERLLRTVTLVVAVPFALAFAWMTLANASKLMSSTVCKGAKPMLVQPGLGVDDTIRRANLHGNLYDIRDAVAELNPEVDIYQLQSTQQLIVPTSCR